MKNLRKSLLIVLMITPLAALAHGEEVMTTLVIPVLSMIILLTTLAFLKTSIATKVLSVAIFVISNLLLLLLINAMPYRDNVSLINLMFAFVPLSIVLITYLVIKSVKSKKY